MSLRIAVAQISSESNHFVTGLAGLDFFRTTGYLLEGPELLDLAGRTLKSAVFFPSSSRRSRSRWSRW